MKTLVLGLGNLILSDDGVGIRVAQEIGKRLKDPHVPRQIRGVEGRAPFSLVPRQIKGRVDESHPQRVIVVETNEAGLNLLDAIIGYDQVIIIDAIQTREGKAGQIYRMEPEDFSFTKALSSPHQINLITALELGNTLNLAMPQKITIFAVEVKDVTNFSEKCTPEVERAIPEVVKMVLHELDR